MGSIYLSNLNITPFYLDSSCGFNGFRPEVMKIMRSLFQRETLNYLFVKLWDPPKVTCVMGIPPLSQIRRSPPSLTALGSANTIT
jgi:hypothetical protein